MIRSFRLWSTVMGAWYGVVAFALLLHPPGDETNIIVNGRVVQLPEHRTYFQVAVGPEVWTTVFGLIAVLLVGTSAWRWRTTRRVHLLALVACYVFGIGYIVNAIQVHQSWLAGGLALVVAAAHIPVSQFGTVAELNAVIAESP